MNDKQGANQGPESGLLLTANNKPTTGDIQESQTRLQNQYQPVLLQETVNSCQHINVSVLILK